MKYIKPHKDELYPYYDFDSISYPADGRIEITDEQEDFLLRAMREFEDAQELLKELMEKNV